MTPKEQAELERADQVLEAVEGAATRYNELLVIAAAISEAVAEEREIIQEAIRGATGPTGGWLIAPSELTQWLRERGA